jgi:hypothetical protein
MNWTDPDRVCPTLPNRGVWKRQRTWYQWVRGSLGAVDSHTVILQRERTQMNRVYLLYPLEPEITLVCFFNNENHWKTSLQVVLLGSYKCYVKPEGQPMDQSRLEQFKHKWNLHPARHSEMECLLQRHSVIIADFQYSFIAHNKSCAITFVLLLKKDLDNHLCKSSSLASMKLMQCLTDFAMRIDISNVSYNKMRTMRQIEHLCIISQYISAWTQL